MRLGLLETLYAYVDDSNQEEKGGKGEGGGVGGGLT